MQETQATSKRSSTIKSIEGISFDGMFTVKRLLRGQYGVLLKIQLTAGSSVPPHKHDHESFCYLLAGQLRLDIAGQERIVKPGDVWLHPEGVLHSTYALADAVWLEFKSPPEEPFE